jgi:hypothetical protein
MFRARVRREKERKDLLRSLGAQSLQRVSLLPDFLWVNGWSSVTLIGTDTAILVGRVRVTKEMRGIRLVERTISTWR